MMVKVRRRRNAPLSETPQRRNGNGSLVSALQNCGVAHLAAPPPAA
jgi:hypothetical protein